MRRFLICTIMASFLVFVSGAPADEKPCYALLSDDAALLDALPTRLRSIVDYAHFHTVLTNDEVVWKPFRDSLDAGLANLGKPFKVQVGEFSATMKFDRDSKGGLRLWLNPLTQNGKRRLPFVPAAKIDGFQFLSFVGAELGWIAKARAAGTLKESISIVGQELRNDRMIDLLGTLGFKRGRIAGPECYIFGIVGLGAGYGAGKLYFAKKDSSVENGQIQEEARKFYRDILIGTTGGVGVAALACFKFSGRNYSLEFNPKEILQNPADRPPVDLPAPIDQIPKEPLPPLKDANPPQLGDPGVN
jgi:hypothetical protein